MELQHVLIMFIMVGLAVTGSFIVIKEFQESYNKIVNESKYLNRFDKYFEISPIVNDTGDKVTSSGNIDEQVGFYSFSKNLWAGLKNIVKTPIILTDILQENLNEYNLGWVVKYLVLAFVIVIIFLLVKYFRWGY